MNTFEDSLNTLLEQAYKGLGNLEAEMLRTSRSFSLSISEIHLLDAVACLSRGVCPAISAISEYLNISQPSVTLAVNKLAGKGYVRRQRCEDDGRVVRVCLTREGRRAERAHRYFHRSMARELGRGMSEDEKRALLAGIGRLSEFLRRNLKVYKEMP